MVQKLGAGDLKYRVDCQKEVAGTDELGNPVPGAGGWVTQFSVRAAYRHLRGGEDVMAGRLQGRHTQVITVRSSSQTRQITAGRRLIDARDGTVFNVRDVTQETDRMWVSLLCERGVAT
ncbi:MAG: phage head closure protein [Mesorhizobium sp.]